MKKSLSRILARMAKDGDIETVAEIIEEMIEPEAAETPVEAIAETVAEIAPAAAPVVEAVAAAAEPEAVIETPEATIVVDESTLADIVSRLDRLIELLTPAPAADDDPAADPAGDPVEEIAEAVEEAIEAAAAAEEEAILPDEDLPESLGIDPEEVAEIVGEILDPVAAEAVSEVLDPTDPLVDECDPEENREALSAGDALRTALRAVRPALVKMPKKQRARVCADIAARLHRPAARRGADAGAGTGAYNALAALKRKPARGNPADLGKRIMASRNVNCCKK
jgi:hypothetical protein